MLAADDAALAELARRLRAAQLGREHSAEAIADLLERLARERAALGAQLRAAEHIAATPATAAAARNTYAKGYREAQARIIALLNYDAGLCAAVMALQPSLADAGAAARAA